MKLEEMANKIQKEYDSLSPAKIKTGLEILSAPACTRTAFRCAECLLYGECGNYFERRKEQAREKLLKVMTEEELNELLFDNLL